MVTATAQFLYSPNHCRFLHLVRHRQGMHNLEAEKSLEALLSPKLFDTPISPLGWQQVADLRKHVLASGLLNRIELVITSPQSWAMQTAVGVFCCERQVYEYGVDTCTPPVMVANDQCNATPALSCPPILAFEKCRDCMMHLDTIFLLMHALIYFREFVHLITEEVSAKKIICAIFFCLNY